MVTTQAPVAGPQVLYSNVNSFDSKLAVRANVETVDDITGAYGKCAKLTGTDSADTNCYYNFSIPTSGCVALLADVIPGENSTSFRFAKTGHAPISRSISASELDCSRWNRLELIVDIDTGKCDLYINGAYDFTKTVPDITVLRLVFDMDKSKISNLSDLTLHVDNIVIHGAAAEQCALTMN